MTDMHIFAESGAIGDTALNLCREHIALSNSSHEKVIIHTTPYLKANELCIPTNPIVHEIWKRTNFIKEVVMDVKHDDEQSFKISKKYGVPIEHPMLFRNFHDIRKWVDLSKFIPEDISKEKVALFQPISLKMKPKEHLNDYIPVWTRCLRTLINNGYRIVLVGAADDPIDLCVDKEFMPYIDNKCGKWTILQAIAFTLYRADVVVSCDSWAGLWGIAARKPTVIAWGYRMENNIDFWVTGFLGNQDCYKFGWSSQKEYCDALLAAYLGSICTISLL